MNLTYHHEFLCLAMKRNEFYCFYPLTAKYRYKTIKDSVKPTTHPAEFWLVVMTRFPKLSDIALICLSVPASTVAAERSFSLTSYMTIIIKAENLPMYNLLYQNSGDL